MVTKNMMSENKGNVGWQKKLCKFVRSPFNGNYSCTAPLVQLFIYSTVVLKEFLWVSLQESV